jgi:Fe-S oxidoreductase
MVDEQVVQNIREYGVASKDSGDERVAILKEQIGFRMDEPAEYVIIGGCFQPGAMPDVLSSFKDVLDRLKVDYTMLSREYCCGWMPIGQPAVMMKSSEDIEKFKEVSKGFIVENFKQAEELGAKSIVLFCGACEPNYSNCKDATELDFISYAELLDRHFEGGSLEEEMDYYPGCYRFRRRITQEPLDIEPTGRLLKRIENLKVNEVDSKLCCYIPPHLDQLKDALTSNNLVTICTGCYHNLKGMLENEGDYRVRMLPELVLEAL